MRGYTSKKRRVVCNACHVAFIFRRVGCVPLHCPPCRAEYRILKGKICNKVMRAVRNGWIKPAAESNCVDCKKEGKRRRAQVLEHRDYDHPLDVVPVCRMHNRLRGPAHWTPSWKKNLPAPSNLRRALTQISDAPDCAALSLMGEP